MRLTCRTPLTTGLFRDSLEVRFFRNIVVMVVPYKQWICLVGKICRSPFTRTPFASYRILSPSLMPRVAGARVLSCLRAHPGTGRKSMSSKRLELTISRNRTLLPQSGAARRRGRSAEQVVRITTAARAASTASTLIVQAQAATSVNATDLTYHAVP